MKPIGHCSETDEGNHFETKDFTEATLHRARGNLRISSMVELVVAVVGLVSACIFLAHAIEAYRA